ncbi:MAG: TetR/AcrR family transcriptional regulator [Gemmatimonadetes bacterium]|nr:TetR/AcrR family transcriptional regulator [Gemmatimonadota bacterium]
MSEHTATEPRWRRLPEERPKQILDAALAVFAERGLAAARLEDIAKLAGVSKGTIYLYFANKEELFRGVVRSTVIEFIERGEAAFEQDRDPMRALDLWMEGHWTWIRSSTFPAMHRLVNSELRDFPDLAAFYATEVVGRAQRLVREILERGMETGVFRRMDANVASRMLSALFVTHGTWYHQKNSFKSIANIPEGALLAQIRDFFLHAMRPEDGRVSPLANT